MKLRILILVSMLTLLLTAGSLQASGNRGATQVLAFHIDDIVFSDPVEGCPAGVATGSLFSLDDGSPIGTVTSCIQSFRGCDPFFVGCNQSVEVILTFAFDEGSIIVPATLHETFISDTTLVDVSHARISHGTGAFEGIRGRLIAFGTLSFPDPTTVESTLVNILIFTT